MSIIANTVLAGMLDTAACNGLTGFILNVRPDGAGGWQVTLDRLPAIAVHIYKGVSMALQVSLDTTQKATLHAQPVNSKGGKALVNGIPAWSMDVPGIVSLFPSDDGLSCDVVALTVGSCNVTVVANASFVPGIVIPISAAVPVLVAAAPAAGIQLTADPVVQQ